MAYDHISLNADQYSLFLENTDTEVQLGDDVQSSGSEFSVILNPALDLSSMLFLRSMQAQMAVSQLVIDRLPLCFTRLEKILVTVVISLDTVSSNQVENRTAISVDNSSIIELSLEDFCCSEAQLAIDYVNKILRYKVNQELIYRYSKVFFDLDIFTENYAHTLTTEDHKLLRQYINIALACRQAVHKALCERSGIDNDIDIDNLITFDESPALNLVDETKILSESICLETVKEREADRKDHNIDLTAFYTILLSQKTTRRTVNALYVIETRALKWLDELQSVHTEELGPTFYINLLEEMITSNKKLIKIGTHLRSILDIQQHSKTEVVSLSLDKNSLICQFHLNHGVFLCGNTDSIKIEFPSHMSYVLGSRTDKNISTNITIGPLTTLTPVGSLTALPRIPADNNILNNNQHLPSSICPMPRMIFVATDTVTAQTRDFWLDSTPYKNFHLIYSQIIDDQTISTRILCKTGIDTVFYKIQRVNSILERISIKILDENFRLVLFPQKTYTRIALIIKPAPID